MSDDALGTPFRRTFPLRLLAEHEEGLLIEILSHLTKAELAKTMSVCSYWYRLNYKVAIKRRTRPLTPDVIFREGEGQQMTLGQHRSFRWTAADNHHTQLYREGQGTMDAIAVDNAPDGATLVTRYTRAASGTNAWQWSGWRMPLPKHAWIRLSVWIAFVDDGFNSLPPPSAQFGLKLHGAVKNSWVSEIHRKSREKQFTWHHVSAVGPATGGDRSHIILIFDSMNSPHRREVLFSGLMLEVFYHVSDSHRPSAAARADSVV